MTLIEIHDCDIARSAATNLTAQYADPSLFFDREHRAFTGRDLGPPRNVLRRLAAPAPFVP